MSREWESSKVMSEFLKIAAESGLISSDLNHEEGLGNPAKETPVKDHRRYEPTEEYGKKTEPADILDKAHPNEAWMAEKSTPVNSMGKGSLVENLKEQQEKDIEIATKMPHGTLVGVHADLVNNLVKLANKLESEGKVKEAIRVDNAIKNISIVPFDNGHLRKEAAGWFLIPFLLSSGFGGAKLFGYKLTSKQENFKIDVKDLYEKLEDYKSRSKSAQKAYDLLTPLIPKIDQGDISTKEGSDEYVKFLYELKPVMEKVKALVNSAKHDIGEREGFFSKMWGGIKDLFGFEDYKLLSAKFDDAYSSYKESLKITSEAKEVEKKVLNNVGGMEKAISLKNVLDSGFKGKKYTTLEDLEVDLNIALKELYDNGKLKKSLTANLVKDGKLIGSPEHLKEVLEIVEKKFTE